MLTKEQLAYYLYLAPELIARGWETEAFYQKVRDFTISAWGDKTATVQWYAVKETDHDLYSIQSVFGGLKGQQPDGASRRRDNAVFPVRGNAAKLGTRQGCVESSALGRAHNARQGV